MKPIVGDDLARDKCRSMMDTKLSIIHRIGWWKLEKGIRCVFVAGMAEDYRKPWKCPCGRKRGEMPLPAQARRSHLTNEREESKYERGRGTGDLGGRRFEFTTFTRGRLAGGGGEGRSSIERGKRKVARMLGSSFGNRGGAGGEAE